MSDRLIAERMGWTQCKGGPILSGHRPGEKCRSTKKGFTCGGGSLFGWPTMRSAEDREAVIAWLNAQGFNVTIRHRKDRVIVSVFEDEGSYRWSRGEAPTIEEAFRAAVLAATEAQE